MTTEKSEKKIEQEEEYASMGCCSPQKMTEMLAKCNKEMHCECVDMIREMMKGGYCKPKQK